MTPNLNIRMRDEDWDRLNRLADATDVQKTTLIQRLLERADEQLGRRAEERIVEELLNLYGAGAVLTVAVEMHHQDERSQIFDVAGTVEREPTDEPAFGGMSPAPPLEQVAILHHELDDRERLTIELGAYDAPGRLYVGTVRLRRSATLSIKLIDLHPAVATTRTLDDGRPTVEFARPDGSYTFFVEREDGTWFLGAEGDAAFGDGERPREA